MTRNTFDYILSKIKHRIEKQDTHLRESIPANMRLAVTLHYLAEGCSFNSIKYHWRIGKSTVSMIIHETCNALWDVLMPLYLKPPQTLDDWKGIAKGFEEHWNFPHCLGAIDGKHIRMQCPPAAGSEYYNYKEFHSLNLMAACDANLKFTLIDVGQAGRWSNAGTMAIPGDEHIQGYPNALSYCFVGDEAFPLKTWLVRPFPGRAITNQQRVYNYRLSRARRTIENAFGVLSSRWRVLQRTMIGQPERVSTIVRALCVLHNLLQSREPAHYMPTGYTNTDDELGLWRNSGTALDEVRQPAPRNSATYAIDMRNSFMQYFNCNSGRLDYQEHHVLHRTN
ncbi:uncharacterized protein [Watersipora subatra]|uniref:uncharacterized protein n=1 Tax=Watersipora subatra TaxID=2589382 RepID=UPI00355BF8FC